MNRIDVWVWVECCRGARDLKLVASVTGIAAARAVQRLCGPGVSFITAAGVIRCTS